MPNPSRVPITQPRVPFLSPETGFVSMPWYLFLLSLNELTSGSEVSLGDLQKGPPQLTVDEINVIINKANEVLGPSQDGLLAQLAELQKQIEALALAPSFVIAGQALTEVDDTNVTLTLGGSPAIALLQPVSMTIGWTGQLAVSRGGTGVSTAPANGQLLIGNGTGYSVANLTAGTNISITNTAGGISIASSNPGGTVTSVGLSAPTGFSVSGSPVTSSGTLALSFAAGYSLPTNASQTNWDTAYSERLQWDGGSTNLVAATGRTSLGATTVGSNLFTLANPSAVTYMRVNADNSVSTLDAATFRTAIGAGTGNGSVTSVATGTGLTGGPITGSGTISFSTAAVGTWAATPSSANLAAAMTDETGSGSLVFATRPSFANTIGVGGATAAASGAGMSFPAVAFLSTDVNTLDDYEEGTWTPTYTPASGSFTSLTVVGAGRYIKVGKTVYIWMDIRTTGASTIGTASGILYITGLPFTVDSNGGYGVCSIFQAYNLGTAFTYLGVITQASTTQMYLTKNTSNGGVTYVQATEINTAAGNFNNLAGIFGMYQTAS